jgi:hypothetical protein
LLRHLPLQHVQPRTGAILRSEPQRLGLERSELLIARGEPLLRGPQRRCRRVRVPACLLDLPPGRRLARFGLALALRALALERTGLLPGLLELLLEGAALLRRRAQLALKRGTLLGL